MQIKILLMSQLIWHSTTGQATTKLINLPEGEAPDGSRIKTSYQCEGSDIHLSCPHDRSIHLIRANYGRFSIAICNHHGFNNLSVDCSSPSSFNVIKNMCNRLTTCTFPVNSFTFDDSCPSTSKYLEVHFSCLAKSQVNNKRPPQSHFLDGDLTSLWSPNRAKLSLETVLRAVKENELHLMTSERVPITTVTITTTTSSPTSPGVTDYSSTRDQVTSSLPMDSQKTHNVVEFPDPKINSEKRIVNDLTSLPENCINGSNSGRTNHTTHAAHGIKEVGFSTRDNYSPLLSHSTMKQLGFALEVVTYSVASFCGLLIIFLVLRYRRPIRRACSCYRPSSSSAGNESTAPTTDSCSPYQEANNKLTHSCRYLSRPCCQDSGNHTVKASNIQVANTNKQNNTSITSGSRSVSRSSRTSIVSELEHNSDRHTPGDSDYIQSFNMNQSGSDSSGRLTSPNPHSSSPHPSLCNGDYNADCGYCQQRQWYQQSSYQLQQQLIYGHNRNRPPSQGSIIGSDV